MENKLDNFISFFAMKQVTLIQMFLLCVISGLFLGLAGCGDSYKMAVDVGSFDVTLPPTVRGAEFNMQENSSAMRVTASVHEPSEKSSHLSRVFNGAAVVCEGEQHCPGKKDAYNSYGGERFLHPSKADIYYNFKSFPVSLSVETLMKSERRLLVYGFGLDPMPYVTAAIGLNSRYGEVGINTYLGLDYSKTDYAFRAIYTYQTIGFGGGTDVGSFEGKYDEYQFNFRGGTGAHASLFLGPVALTYVPMFNIPWLWTTDLKTREPDGILLEHVSRESDFDVTFKFPFYFSNYFGFTYNAHGGLQYSLGLTVINGTQLDERLIFASTSISYLF